MRADGMIVEGRIVAPVAHFALGATNRFDGVHATASREGAAGRRCENL